ncbi:MAG: ADP-ribosylglycohydrolase family protein [Candidatus Limnocylindrales bacterium]
MTMRDDATDLATRLIGGVWGHLVGDAVGVPYEFRSPAQIGEVRFGATGTHGQPPGTWSDDGSLMLALLDTLLEDEPGAKDTRVTARFDPEAQGRRIVAWRRDKAYTPDGDGLFDIGNATSAAIRALEAGTPAEMAGGLDEWSCGNGSLMRILPIALVNHDLPDGALADMAHRASSVTHRHPRAQVACALYVLVAKRLLAGAAPGPTLADARASLRALYAGAAADADRLAALDHLEAYPDRAGRGRVWDSFWSAWDAFSGAGSYQETIERATAYGNDTDTTAAIAGGLAGIRWSVDGIPPAWLESMRGREIADPLVDRLLALHGWRTSTNPIRVDWVDLGRVPGLRGVAAAGGRLGMTFLPGKQGEGLTGMHWRTLAADVPRLAEAHGVDTLLLLVEDHELDAARVPGIADVMAAAGIDLVRFPIRDTSVTRDRDGLRAVLGDLVTRLAAGQSVAVACRGGWGRTGTIVGCLLRDGGLDARDAIALTRASRPGTIENSTQEAFVSAWDWPDRVVLV